MTAPLLNCPHCGGNGLLHQGMGEYWVSCDKCGNGTNPESKVAAIMAWNRRAHVSTETIKRMCAASMGFESVNDWEIACENEQAITSQLNEMRAAVAAMNKGTP